MLVVTTAKDMGIETVYRIMKARWNIENRVFNNLKNNANLNHCFVHGDNAAETIGLFEGIMRLIVGEPDRNTLTFNPGWDRNYQPTESFTDIREIQKQLNDKGINIKRNW